MIFHLGQKYQCYPAQREEKNTQSALLFLATYKFPHTAFTEEFMRLIQSGTTTSLLYDALLVTQICALASL